MRQLARYRCASTTQFPYDGEGRLSGWQSESVAPIGWTGFTVFRIAETQYDAMGRKTRDLLKRADGTIEALTQYTYDAIGRLDCTAVRMNPAIYGSLPSSACTPGTTGSQGPDRIARNIYDAAGQRLQLREGVGSADEGTEATWAYNLNGQVTTVIDGNGNRATLQYDGHGRQTGWTFPSTTRASAFNDATPATALSTAGSVNTNDYEAYTYDLAGRRTNLRKRDGRNIAFAYDALGRVTAKTYPQGGATAVYYGYDLRGLQLFARFTSTSGEGITNVFDGFGRLTSTTSNMGGTARALTYQYDGNGSRTRITHPDGVYFRTDYDGLSRPASIWENGATNMSGFTYYSHGAVSGLSRANGTASGFGYDAVQRLSGMVQYLSGTAYDGYWSYGRNPAGQIGSVSRDNNVYAWAGHYATTRAYTTNGLNQYSAAGSASFVYDANGNLTSDGTRTFTYDIENRMVGATGGVVLGYDPLGRLHQVSSTAGPTTAFLYDGDALMAEYVSGAMTRRYVHNVGADVPLLSYQGATLSLPSYLHADERGSIVAISDASGNGSVNSYDEYGIPGAGNTGRFQYTGQAWVPELGMYHYKARIYSPTLGRFMQTDTIGYDDQFNLYGYVGNDPVNQTDPTGMASYLVSRPTGYLGQDHMFVIVVDRLGDRPRAIYSFGPTGTPLQSLFGGSKLVSLSGTNTPTAIADQRAAITLASTIRAGMAGVSAVRIRATDAAVMASGQSATEALGTLRAPGNVPYSAYPSVTSGANSNGVAYVIANSAVVSEGGASGSQQLPPGAGVPGAAQTRPVEEAMRRAGWSIEGSRITGSRGCGSRLKETGC